MQGCPGGFGSEFLEQHHMLSCGRDLSVLCSHLSSWQPMGFTSVIYASFMFVMWMQGTGQQRDIPNIIWEVCERAGV